MDIIKKYGAMTLAVLFALSFSTIGLADSTQVLPKGRSAVDLSYMTMTLDREFDDSGENRELGYYFNRVNVTPLALVAFNAKYGLPAGTPSVLLAMTYLDAKAEAEAMVFSYQYGVTDRLTVGIGFPYFTNARTDVEFQALVWPNPLLGLPPGPLDMTKDAQKIIMNTFGYDKLESWNSGPGIGDLRLGAKYRFLDEDRVKAAAGAWVKLPTGKVDDERNLADIAYGSGGYDTAAYAMVDLIPVDNLTLNLTGRYVVSWPYERGVFMLDKTQPLFYDAEMPTRHVFGEFDRGDWYELESEATVTAAPGIEFFVGGRFMQSESNFIDDEIMPKTAIISRTAFMGARVSSIEAYKDGEAKLPMVLSVYAEPVQSGKNTQKTVTSFISLTILF